MDNRGFDFNIIFHYVLYMNDTDTLHHQPSVKIWGEGLHQLESIGFLKGKFVVTRQRQIFICLIPLKKWEAEPFFHDQLLKDLGIKSPLSPDVKAMIAGGGKITVEAFDQHVEVALYGKSTLYGSYDRDFIPETDLKTALEHRFGPVLLDLD